MNDEYLGLLVSGSIALALAVVFIWFCYRWGRR